MPRDTLADVSVGDPFPTDVGTVNALMRAARKDRQPPSEGKTPAPQRFIGYVEALALNDTGADLDAFKPARVAGADDYDLTDSGRAYDWLRRVTLTLDVPGDPTDVVAVTIEAIPDGAYGRVAVAGWCACDVDISDAGHAYASPGTDTDALVSGTSGSVRIVATGTGTARRTQVYLGGQAAAPCREYPLGDPCLIPLVDEGSAIVGVAGMAQRWVLCDGTVECREYGFCDPACGRTEVIGGTSPPPPVTVNEIRVELLIAGGGTDIRDITVTDGVTPVTQTTDGSGRTTFLMPDGTYTVTLDDVFGGETVDWDLTVAVVDSGSGAVTDSFAVSGGATVICQFSIVSPP